MVLVEHAPLNLIWWNGPLTTALGIAGRGWPGVDLFFAVSGFVIGRVLLPTLDGVAAADATVPLLRFWCRRAWRLLPSALLWLALPLIPALVFDRSGAFHTFRADAAMALAAAIDLANIHLAEWFGRGDTGLAFPYWSLSLEEQFYLVLPISCLVFRRHLPVLLGLLLLTTVQSQTPLSMMVRAGALALGYANIFVTAPSPENLRTLFEFVFKVGGLAARKASVLSFDCLGGSLLLLFRG